MSVRAMTLAHGRVIVLALVTCFFVKSLAIAQSEPVQIGEPIAVPPSVIEPMLIPDASSAVPQAVAAPPPVVVTEELLVSVSQAKRRWIPLPEGLFPPITGKTSEAHRHLGLGTPLTGALSWNALSHSAGFYIGGMDGAQTVNSHLEHQLGTTLGMRFGLDYDYHWGLEKRFGFASLEARDSFSHLTQHTELEFGDVDLYFYPWGDSLWRPFMMCGVGLSRYNHEDTHQHIERYLLTSPFGIGLKRLVNKGFDLRVDITDNLLLGSGPVGTMNNMSLSAGAEFRYKGFNLIR